MCGNLDSSLTKLYCLPRYIVETSLTTAEEMAMEIVFGTFQLSLSAWLLVLFGFCVFSWLLVRGMRSRRQYAHTSSENLFPWVEAGKVIECRDTFVRSAVKNLRGGRKHVAILDVRGIILSHASDAPMLNRTYATFGNEVQYVLRVLSESESIAGVLVRFDTPGGLELGAKLISDGLELCKAQGKTVVAHVSRLSASGGVYAMAPAVVVADEMALVGSVGVRGPNILEYDEVNAIGAGVFGSSVTAKRITAHPIYAGKGKNLGDPFQKPDPGALRSLQQSVTHVYIRFLTHLNRLRKIPAQELLNEGARLFNVHEAIALRLVNTVGDERFAAHMLAADQKIALSECTFLHVRFSPKGKIAGLFAHLLEPFDSVLGISKTSISHALSHSQALLLPQETWWE